MNKIDVFIPAIEKDLDVLPHSIDSVRKQVRHPIGDIFIVAPENKKIKNLCIAKGCQFVDENSLLPLTKKDINYSPIRKGISVNRSGWLFQQFIKLGAENLGSSDSYLVLDADTVLIRPHVFEDCGKSIFFCRSLYYRPYFTTYERLMGEAAPGPARSIFFVSHYMYFKKSCLREFKRLIESRHDTDWYTAILNSINYKQWDSFSEFETYGNFMLKNHPQEIILQPRRNLSLKRSRIANISKIDMKQLVIKHNIRSISFHSWND